MAESPPPRTGLGHIEGVKDRKNNENKHFFASVTAEGGDMKLVFARSETTKQSFRIFKFAKKTAARLSDAVLEKLCALDCHFFATLSKLPSIAYRVSPVRFSARNDMKRAAFTLAETLIALVVIGIVAAITVPAIVAHQREAATVEKVKKFYSTMSNAVKRAIVDTGLNVDEWDFENANPNRSTSVKFMKYIKPYLIIAADDCGKDENGSCYSTLKVKKLNGADQASYYASLTYYKAVLNDGSVFWLRTDGTSEGRCGNNDICAWIWYDINGTKEPNTYGKDIFSFLISTQNVITHTANDCKLNSDGWGCSTYILKNGNMNYLH